MEKIEKEIEETLIFANILSTRSVAKAVAKMMMPLINVHYIRKDAETGFVVESECPNLGKDAHNHPSNPCPICQGTGKISTPLTWQEKDEHYDKVQRILHEIYEEYAGQEGVIPETAPEGYLLSLVKRMATLAQEGMRINGGRIKKID